MRSLLRAAAIAAAAVALLSCDDGLHPVLQPTSCPPPPAFVGICGTVTFQGAVPDSTDEVVIVAYPTFPQSKNDLFNFQPSPLLLKPLPLDTTSAFYAVPLPSGRYAWVVAVWLKQGWSVATADSTIRAAGWYRSPADTSQAGVVNVYTEGTDSIDFTVDFAHMVPPCKYYAPPCP